jgi:hypothetical protein
MGETARPTGTPHGLWAISRDAATFGLIVVAE